MSQWTPEDAENIRKAIVSVGEGFNRTFEEISQAVKHMSSSMEESMKESMEEQPWWEEAYKKDMRDRYPVWIEQKGPRPHKGGYCGFCATATDKEQRKLDSCPQCGKSYMKYGRK